MLTLTLMLIGIALVVGSVALIGLCVMREPPPHGRPPPRGHARRLAH